jgi:methylated-DNA-[protein]-cysteine S-methyltransferase
MTMETLFERRLASPLGELCLIASDRALRAVYFAKQQKHPALQGRRVARHPVLDLAGRELREYFAGRRTSFSVPCELRGTPFQRRVFRALRAIPHGQTRSYAEIARSIGRPGASRAVGASNRVNPIGLIVPCHRVIGADGSLTGYAAGVARKRWLLEHERDVAARAGRAKQPARS